ncbi:MAG: hypothetical protein ACU85E_16560, partial [Gammaproteobacteria bacterium]
LHVSAAHPATGVTATRRIRTPARPSEVIGTDFPYIMTWDSDKPRLENFTRVETFGNPNAHWVKVTVDRNSSNVFSFEQKFVEKNRSNTN